MAAIAGVSEERSSMLPIRVSVGGHRGQHWPSLEIDAQVEVDTDKDAQLVDWVEVGVTTVLT